MLIAKNLTRRRILAAFMFIASGSVVGCEPEGTGTVKVSEATRKRLKPGRDIDAGGEPSSRKKKKSSSR